MEDFVVKFVAGVALAMFVALVFPPHFGGESLFGYAVRLCKAILHL